MIKLISKTYIKILKKHFNKWCHWNLYDSILKNKTRVQFRPNLNSRWFWAIITKSEHPLYNIQLSFNIYEMVRFQDFLY